MKRTATFFCILTVILGTGLPRPVGALSASENPAAVVINEVQTGGCASGELGRQGEPTTCAQENGTLEFIELYNTSDTDADITDWRLEYLSSSHTGSEEPTRVLIEFVGIIEANGYVLASYANYLGLADAYFGTDSTSTSGLLAKSGGHVRLVDPSGTVIDQLGWGSAKQIGAWQRVAAINPGYSAKRLTADNANYAASAPFSAPTIPTTPLGGGLRLSEPEVELEQSSLSGSSNTSPGTLNEPLCTDVLLSEVLPNPAGADSGQEFIELYNPLTTEISLLGCELRLGAAGKLFTLPNVIVPSRGYVAFYDSETKLTLPNASGTQVWLLGATFEESTQYPDALADNQSWANVDGVWQKASPTPNAQNLADPKPNTGTAGVSTPAASTHTLTPCKAGQERSPDTNRCRTITSSNTTSISACKPGQERNPQTNRCRNIPTVAEVKACPAGQERNPESGRCRKVTSSDSASTTITDIASPVSTQASWLVAGTAVAGAGGYGVYEWRRDILRFLSGIKERLKS